MPTPAPPTHRRLSVPETTRVCCSVLFNFQRALLCRTCTGLARRDVSAKMSFDAAVWAAAESLRRYSELFPPPTVPADDADLTTFGMPSLKAKAVQLGIKKDGVGWVESTSIGGVHRGFVSLRSCCLSLTITER